MCITIAPVHTYQFSYYFPLNYICNITKAGFIFWSQISHFQQTGMMIVRQKTPNNLWIKNVFSRHNWIFLILKSVCHIMEKNRTWKFYLKAKLKSPCRNLLEEQDDGEEGRPGLAQCKNFKWQPPKSQEVFHQEVCSSYHPTLWWCSLPSYFTQFTLFQYLLKWFTLFHCYYCYYFTYPHLSLPVCCS